MQNDIYRRLQQHLDRMPVPFPATESGVEITLLKHLFDEEEAGITLNLSALGESIERIHRRFRKNEITRERLQEKLDGLAEKGAIMAVRDSRGGKRYSKLPLVIGMFEFQVDRITRELAEDFFRYEDEGFADAVLKNKTGQMRTIPVNIDITAEFPVGQYDSARAIIESSPGPFAVMNCVCRQAREKMGEKCRQTDIMETCFTLGKSAGAMVERGVARQLTREEMLELIGRAEQERMVLQPSNTQNPGFICCCCGCCCGVLTAAKKYDNPSEFLLTNFVAEISPDLCTGCEACHEQCQMDALVTVGDRTVVLNKRCIGCGLCVKSCPTEAIVLVKKGKEQVPPKNSMAMYRQMARERYGLVGTLKLLGKVAFGGKI